MSYNVSDWMWIVGDTNPTTQVYSSAAGGMIANNSAAFLTWLSGRAGAIAIGDHDGYSIGAAADNGSGLIRLTVTTTARMQTGQRWAVAGSGSANVDGNWPITIVNATQIDLQGSNSAWASAVTGGYVLGATFIDTMANLTAVLNRAAFTRFQEATKSFSSAVDLALDNPLAATSLISMTAAGKSVTLPAMNAVNSVPVGVPFSIVNTGAFAFTLKDKAGSTLGEFAPEASWQLTNTSNATAAGSFQTIVTLYNSGTAGILQTAPKTDTAAAQGDWTNLAHQSNPGQFDGRNNEVWGFGYNLSNNWSSRNGLDDGIGMGWETHYHPSSGIGPQFEAHVVRVGKKAGGEFRPLSFFIQKWDTTASVGAYWTAGTVLADDFSINRPSNNADVFRFFTHQTGTPTSKGVAFFNDAPLFLQGDALTDGTLQVFHQQNASFDIVVSYRFSGADKWRTFVRKSTFNFELVDDVAGAVHTTWYSNGGVAIGAPTGGNKGFGTLNATAIYVNNKAALTENSLAGSVLGYADGMVNGTLSVTASASALTIAIKTLAGNDPSATDPIYVIFRNAAGTTGDYVVITLMVATSFTISSGSTMGVTSSKAFRLWIVGLNDGGTFRLGAINCVPTLAVSGSSMPYPLVEGLENSTAEGGAGAADSAGVIYTGTAVSLKPMRILGYAEWSSSGLTAGTWTTTNLLRVQLFGPGIKKPGEIVQRLYKEHSTQAQATSTTRVQSVAIDVTPKSAANLFRVVTSGAAYEDTGSTVSTLVVLRRGTTEFGPIGQAFAGGQVISAIAIFGWDAPNTTSSTTYNAAVYKSGSTGKGYYPYGSGSSPTVNLEVEEVMA
jgi:hypothetical protein